MEQTAVQSNDRYDVTRGSMRVPWVTRWTGEQRPWIRQGSAAIASGLTPLKQAFLHIDVPPGGGWDDVLVEPGVIWWDELPGKQNQGKPQWSEVSATRQRRAMREHLCQVCAGPVGTDWVLPRHLLVPMRDKSGQDAWITPSPPVCEDCVPVAFVQCPHLKRPEIEVIRLHDVQWREWGVDGDAITLDRARGGLVQRHNVYLPYVTPDADPDVRAHVDPDTCLIGKQLAMELSWRNVTVEKAAAA